MKISAVNSPNQQINIKGKLIKPGNLSAKENNAIESFMSLVTDGITNRTIIEQKPYDIYVDRSPSKKNCLQIARITLLLLRVTGIFIDLLLPAV